MGGPQPPAISKARGRETARADMPQKAPFPKKLTVALTDRCNLKCFICTREEFEEAAGSKGRNMALEHVKSLEAPIRAAEVIQLSGFGESFLYPQLDEVLNFIYAVNPRDNLIYMISNGTLLSRSWAEKLGTRLNYLAISLNAANPETYKRDMHPYLYRYTRQTAPSAYRGKMFAEDNKRERPNEFAKVVERIADFMSGLPDEARHRVGLHYVVHRDNLHELPAFVHLAQSIGVQRVELNPYMVNRVENIEYSIYFQKEAFNRQLEEAKALGQSLGVQVIGRAFFKDKERTFDPVRDCQWPNEEAIVFTEGQVTPCCHIGDISMGNTADQPFEEIWNNRAYQELRQERWFEACHSCNLFQTFDDWRTHFHPGVKMSPRFEELADQFETQEERAPLKVLVVGAGRDGTRSAAALIGSLYAANGEDVRVQHEAESFRNYRGVADYVKRGDPARITGVLKSWRSEIVAGNGFGFILPVLHEVYGDDLRIVHAKRERDACIRSLIAQTQANPLYWAGYLSDDTAADPADTAEVRPTAPMLGRMDPTEWRAMSQYDRLGWYYDTTHAEIEAHIGQFPHRLDIATEQLSNPGTARRLAAFLDPGWANVTAPVHLNGRVYETPREQPDATATWRHKSHDVLADLDLQQLAASNVYPIVFFLQRLLQDRDTTLAELAQLRDDIDDLLANREPGQPRANGNAEPEDAPPLRLDKLMLSSDQQSDVANALAGLDLARLAGSNVYALVHFLHRLKDPQQTAATPAQVGNDDQANATIQFIGEQIDALIHQHNDAA